MRLLLLLLVSLTILYASDEQNQTQKFDTITVKEQQSQDNYQAPDYLESQTYVKDLPGQQRLTAKEAMHLPGVQGDPVKAIKLLAGITSTGSSGALIVHASKPRETLTTINQLPIGYLFHLGGLHSVIAPESIEQLDIYLGGFDVTYNNAMGGILDITPKYPYGSNSGFVHMGIFDASFGFDGKLSDKINFFIGGRRSYFDLFIDKFTAKNEDTNTTATITQFPRYWDATTMVSYTNENHQISLENVNAGDKASLVIDGNIQDPQANGDIDSTQGFNSVGLRWVYNNYENYQANTLLYYMNNRFNIELFDGLKLLIDNRQTGLKHISSYTSAKHKLSFGAYIQHYDVPLDVNITRQPTAEDYNYSITGSTIVTLNETVKTTLLTLFVQDLYSFNDKVALRYGLNYITSDRNQLTKQIDPRASLRFQANETNLFALSVGQYSQTPQQSQLVGSLGNPNLTFERAIHYTMRYAHTFSQNHTLSLEPYYKSFDQLSLSDPLLNYASVGKGDAYGIDISYKKRAANYYLLATYTYSQAHRQINSSDEALYPFYAQIPHTLNLIASYKLNARWDLSALIKYQSGLPYTPVIGTTTATNPVDSSSYIVPIYGDPFSATLHDTFMLNIKALYQKPLSKKRRLELSLELMNATNHKNEIGISYNNDYTKEIRTVDLPLLPWFDITYYF